MSRARNTRHADRAIAHSAATRMSTPSSCCRSSCGRRAACARSSSGARKSASSSSGAPCCAVAIACRPMTVAWCASSPRTRTCSRYAAPIRKLLARAAYHLGNRHAPVQVGRGWLRIAADEVLAGMLRGLGATVTPVARRSSPRPAPTAAGATRMRRSDASRRHPRLRRRAAIMGPDGPAPVTARAATDAAAAAAGAPVAAREPGAADRCVQLLAGPGTGRRGRRRARCRDGAGMDRRRPRPRRRARRGCRRVAPAARRGLGLAGVRAVERLVPRVARNRGTCAPRPSRWAARSCKLAIDLDLLDAPARDVLPALAPITLPAAYALAARGFAVPVDAGARRRTSGPGSKTRCWRRSSWCRSARSPGSGC